MLYNHPISQTVQDWLGSVYPNKEDAQKVWLIIEFYLKDRLRLKRAKFDVSEEGTIAKLEYRRSYYCEELDCTQTVREIVFIDIDGYYLHLRNHTSMVDIFKGYLNK